MALYKIGDLLRRRSTVLRAAAQVPVFLAVRNRPRLVLLSEKAYWRLIALTIPHHEKELAARRALETRKIGTRSTMPDHDFAELRRAVDDYARTGDKR